MALTQQRNRMAHAATRASENEVLRVKLPVSLYTPPFQTRIAHDRTGINYTVSHGSESMSGEVLWSMGDGAKGQTFILQYLGMLFESQLSYFSALDGFDITPEHPRGKPDYLERAFGMAESAESAQHCFACHTTASSTRNQFDPDRAIPGVTCEACHGPGARHVQAMRSKQIQQVSVAILDPSGFGPVESVDFCGACHRTPLDVTSARDYVPLNVRFQPYRLSKSRCWSRPDPRLTCVACHDPHQPLVQDVDYYDSKCAACHSASAPNASATAQSRTGSQPHTCPVGKQHCVSCHMPKYQFAEFHGSFTDHDIRVVHPNDPYPL
jgi:hypothetical protein